MNRMRRIRHWITSLGAAALLLAMMAASWGLAPALAQTSSPPPAQGPERKTTIKINVVQYEWWLLFWSNNQLACKLFIEHDGLPTAEDIGLQCGSQLQSAWQQTGPCTVVSSDQSSQCKGLYLHLVGNYTLQREIPINLPPPEAWISITGCDPVPPQNACDQLPSLLITAREPLPNETIIDIQGRVGDQPFSCGGASCTIPLQPTSQQGVEVEFWADSSFGDSTATYSALVRAVPWGDFMAPEGPSDTHRMWYVGVISDRWVGAPLASCSQTWQSFPDLGGPPEWLTTPSDPAGLTTEVPYYYLAGALIEQGYVDASGCPDGGLSSPGVANQCGLEQAGPQVAEWQNKFNKDIFDAAKDTGIPAQLIKRIFSRESQFWPGMYQNQKEVGLGQLTENGADTLLGWNYSFYSQFCPLVFSQDTCLRGFTTLTAEQQATLRGALLSKVNAQCPDCSTGIDLSRADYSVRVFARTLLANCEQVSGIVSAATRQAPGMVASYEDLWRFTLTNYNAGSGCLTDAINGAIRAGERLDWNHVSAHLTDGCQGALQYVQDITGENNSPNLSPTSTP